MTETPTPEGERSRRSAIVANVFCVLAGVGGATFLALAILDFAAYSAFVLRFLR